MARIIAIGLIAGALVLGYMGVQKVRNNSASMEVLGLELKAANESAKREGYIYLGLGVVLLAGGIYALRKK